MSAVTKSTKRQKCHINDPPEAVGSASGSGAGAEQQMIRPSTAPDYVKIKQEFAAPTTMPPPQQVYPSPFARAVPGVPGVPSAQKPAATASGSATHRVEHIPTHTMAAPAQIGVTNTKTFHPVQTSMQISQMLARKQPLRVRQPPTATATASASASGSEVETKAASAMMLGPTVFAMPSVVPSIPSARHISSHLQVYAPIEKLLRDSASYEMLPSDRQNLLMQLDETLAPVGAMFKSAAGPTSKRQQHQPVIPPSLSADITKCVDTKLPMVDLPTYGPEHEDQLLYQGGKPRPSPKSNFMMITSPPCSNGPKCYAFRTKWQWIPSTSLLPHMRVPFLPMMWMSPDELSHHFLTGEVPARGPGPCLICCRNAQILPVLLHESDKTTPRGMRIQQWCNTIGPGGYRSDCCMPPSATGFNGLYGPLAWVAQPAIRAQYDEKYKVLRLNQDLMKHDPIEGTGSAFATQAHRAATASASIAKEPESAPKTSNSVFRK